jgi:hypothetical protein
MRQVIVDSEINKPIWTNYSSIGSHVGFHVDDGSIITVKFNSYQKKWLGLSLEAVARKTAQQHIDRLAPEKSLAGLIIEIESRKPGRPGSGSDSQAALENASGARPFDDED